MPGTTTFDRGAVVLVKFVFADEKGAKKRPVLVLSSRRYHAGRREVVVAAITSRVDRLLVGDHEIVAWRHAGLPLPSVVTGILRSGPSGICVLLFPEGNGTPEAVGTTTERGQFALPRPAPGSYVLVAALLGTIDDLAVSVRISDIPADPERGLLLHVRAEEDDRGGFASAIPHLALRRELLEMARVDQAVRNEWMRETPSPRVRSFCHGWPRSTRRTRLDCRRSWRSTAGPDRNSSGWMEPGARS